MAGWPGYWEGLPPMHYATHCVSPCLGLPGKLAESVVCHGSGRISEKLTAKYGSPFAVETATIKLRDSDCAAEVTRSLFETARQYIESFDVYGDKVAFEWPRIEHEPCVLHRGEKPERVEGARLRRIACPKASGASRPRACTTPTRRSTCRSCKAAATAVRTRTWRTSSSARSSKTAPPLPDAATSANWTMTGICAHQSAMKGGERVQIPRL